MIDVVPHLILGAKGNFLMGLLFVKISFLRFFVVFLKGGGRMKRPINRDENGRLITTDMAVRRYNLNRNKILEIGRASGALLKIGKLSRFDVEKMDKYMLETYSEA